MILSKLKPKEWREKRDKLTRLLGDTCLRPSRILNYDDAIMLEGGSFPAIYYFFRKELVIWGRGNRYSGSQHSIAELVEAQEVIRTWHKEELS